MWLSLTSVALGHFWSVVIRSRTRWQLADLAGLLLCAAGAWWSLAILIRSGAFHAVRVEAVILAGAAPPAFLVAGAVQTVGGRTDIRRGHRLLSLTMWPTLGVVVLLLLGGAAWMVTPDPDDLVVITSINAAPQGAWVALSGGLWGRGGWSCGFLVDTNSGTWARVPDHDPWSRLTAFSGDGRRAVWVVSPRDPGADAGELMLAELGRDGPRLRYTPITFPPGSTPGSAVALNEDGSLVAVVGYSHITVSTLPEGAVRAAVRLPKPLFVTAAFFTGPDRVRIYGWRTLSAEQRRLVIGELDIAQRNFRTTGGIELPGNDPAIRFDHGLERLVAMWGRGDSKSVAVFDARTGRLVSDLRRPGWTPESLPAFLADGGLAQAERRGRQRRLRLIAGDGNQRMVALPPIEGRYWPALEPRPGTLLVGVQPRRSWSRGHWDTLVVDLADGSVRKLGSGFPAFGWAPWNTTRTPPPGSVATRLLVDHSQLLALNPDLRSTSVVVGTRSD